MAKKQLTEKQYKKLIKKLKDAKKAKRKRPRNKNVNQRVSQNVIIGSNISEKKQTDAGRSFPVIQFLPQMQSQNMDTQLLRDLLLRNISSPLTKEVTSRVPYRPSYDLGDQYGLNLDNPVNLGIPRPEYDAETDISDLTDFGSLETNYNNDNDFNTDYLLKPPPEKQGNLDAPIPNPKPNALAQTKITGFYEPQPNETDVNDLFSRATEKFPDDDEYERPNETSVVKPKNNNKKIKFIIEGENEDETQVIDRKKRGRPPGSRNKKKDTSKDTSKVFIDEEE